MYEAEMIAGLAIFYALLIGGAVILGQGLSLRATTREDRERAGGFLFWSGLSAICLSLIGVLLIWLVSC